LLQKRTIAVKVLMFTFVVYMVGFRRHRNDC